MIFNEINTSTDLDALLTQKPTHKPTEKTPSPNGRTNLLHIRNELEQWIDNGYTESFFFEKNVLKIDDKGNNKDEWITDFRPYSKDVNESEQPEFLKKLKNKKIGFMKNSIYNLNFKDEFLII